MGDTLQFLNREMREKKADWNVKAWEVNVNIKYEIPEEVG